MKKTLSILRFLGPYPTNIDNAQYRRMGIARQGYIDGLQRGTEVGDNMDSNGYHWNGNSTLWKPNKRMVRTAGDCTSDQLNLKPIIMTRHSVSWTRGKRRSSTCLVRGVYIFTFCKALIGLSIVILFWCPQTLYIFSCMTQRFSSPQRFKRDF